MSTDIFGCNNWGRGVLEVRIQLKSCNAGDRTVPHNKELPGLKYQYYQD